MSLTNHYDFIDLIPWSDKAPDVIINFPTGTFGYRSKHIQTDMFANQLLSLLVPPSSTSSVTPTGRVVGYITGVELTNVIYSKVERYYKLYGYSQLVEADSAKRLLIPGHYKAIPLFPKILGNQEYVHGLGMVYYIVPIDGPDDSISYYNQLRTGTNNDYSIEYLEKHHPYPKVDIDQYNEGNPDQELRDLFNSMIYYQAEINGDEIGDLDALYLLFLKSKEYRNSLRAYLPPIEYTAAVKLVLNYLKYGSIGMVGDQVVFGSSLVWQLYGVKLDIHCDTLYIVKKLANDIDILNQCMVYAYDLDRPIDDIIIGWYLTLKSLDDAYMYVDHYEDISNVSIGVNGNGIKVTSIDKVSLLGWVKLYYNSPNFNQHVNKMIEIGADLGNEFLTDLYYYNYLGYGVDIRDGKFVGLINDGYIPLDLKYQWQQAAIDLVG